MTEILFYHLENRTLETVLPTLVEKSLDRDWRVVVQCGSPERMEALDGHLWTWREESFLPHGTAADGDSDLQPVFLTAGDENPNSAAVRFLVDRAVPGNLDGYVRVVFLFDGRDEEAVLQAREHWKAMAAAANDVTYWQQDDRGRWVRKS